MLVVLAVSAFVIWGSTPSGPSHHALAALESSGGVTVITDNWLVFQPDEPTGFGLVLYPGGRVAPESYAPLAHAIAENGALVVIVPMPLNLAVFGANRAEDVISAYPEVTVWAVGGHSLGGAMAARYVYEHPEVQGLVLWAAYPAQSNDLSGRNDLAVISIAATLDGLATEDKIMASRALLPAATQWVRIEGGNHAQFGSYGAQDGDLEAILSAAEQHTQVIQATHAFLIGIE